MSDVALFPRDIYMEIEFLILDLHLKRKQKKPTRTTGKENHNNRKYVFIREEEKKKKTPETERSHGDLGRTAAWSCATWVGLSYISISSSSSSSLSFYFSFFPRFFAVSTFWVRNRVLKTRFSCRCHLENMPHQTWTTHENRVSKTRFIDLKSSLLDSRC